MLGTYSRKERCTAQWESRLKGPDLAREVRESSPKEVTVVLKTGGWENRWRSRWKGRKMLPRQNGTENTKVLRQEEAEQVKGIERRPGGYPVTEWSDLLSYGLGSGMLEQAYTSFWDLTPYVSSQFHIQWLEIGQGGCIYTIKISQVPFYPQRASLLAHHWIELCGAMPGFRIQPFQVIPNLRIEATKRHILGEEKRLWFPVTITTYTVRAN